MRPDEGARLKAFVVPVATTAHEDALRLELRRFATASLSPAERPGTYAFCPPLPRGAMGKLAEWNG